MKLHMIPVERGSEMKKIDILNEQEIIFETQDGQWGFLDENGRIVGGRLWDFLGSASEGLRDVRLSGLYGFVDGAGRVVIEPEWEEVSGFCNGRCVVTRDGKKGAIDREGKVVIQPEWDWMYPFWNDRAMVIRDHRFNYMDKDGRLISDAWWDLELQDDWWNPDSCFFCEGFAAVKKDGLFGFINTSGKLVIGHEWQGAKDFFDGLAPVQRNGRWGCINVEGELVIPCAWDDLIMYGDGLIIACRDEKWGFIDHQGEIKLEIAYEDGMDWQYGRCTGEPVIIRENGARSFYFDTEARSIIRGPWTPVEDFMEGRAIVYQDGKLGYIDRSGKFISEDRWDDNFYGTSFRGGFARVFRDGKCGVIGLDGGIVCKPEWEWVNDFSGGCFVASGYGGHYLLFPDGRCIQTEACDMLHPFHWGYSLTAQVKDGQVIYRYMGLDGKFIRSYTDENGETQPMPEWSQAGIFFRNRTTAELDGQLWLLVQDAEDEKA